MKFIKRAYNSDGFATVALFVLLIALVIGAKDPTSVLVGAVLGLNIDASYRDWRRQKRDKRTGGKP